MEKTRLKYQGPGTYKSTDHVTGATIAVTAGVEILLSVEKARQVLRDFPTQWERLDAVALAPAAIPAAPVPQPAAPPAPIVSPAAPVVSPEPPAVSPAPKPAPKKKGARR